MPEQTNLKRPLVRSDPDAFGSKKRINPRWPYDGRVEVYFVQCKGCKGEIEIDRKPTGEATFFSGTFNTFPDCPHCGQKQYYVYSDIRTRRELE